LASKSRTLRTGYTTGACAAAAAKAATVVLLGTKTAPEIVNRSIEIPFPDGARHALMVSRISCGGSLQGILASVIKDAGDDPDVTDGAEIIAEVVFLPYQKNQEPVLSRIIISGGKGVGRVTRPGLPVAVGEPAINPVPRRMITEAVAEALESQPDAISPDHSGVEVTISVPEGESIARKTLNDRIGIIGGISILGTTGIVKPISAEAWTATIATSMNVAQAMNEEEVVISSGRASEKAHIAKYALPDHAYVMVGDYLEFGLLEARKRHFRRIHLVAQWAKMLKAAMEVPQTHIKHGAIDPRKVILFLMTLGCQELKESNPNTAREIFEAIRLFQAPRSTTIFASVCSAAATYAESVTCGIPVTTHLVSYEGEIIAHNG
jgi:cobalt-precorrin-5B (C1)-methyltransferase